MHAANQGTIVGMRGLGTMDEGWGFFPSLFALQFQNSVPPPSASVADLEEKEKRRLQASLYLVALLVFFYFIIS